MQSSTLSGVRVAGIVSAVPSVIRSIEQDIAIFGAEEVQKISASTGILQRHLAPQCVCTSDLCFAAAERLLDDLGWARDSVDGVIFVSQTPDFILPSTACVLQNRLGLSTACAAFDVNLGCSGYVYGLWLASSLVSAGSAHRILLLVGDTISHCVSPEDRSTALLFGDAGTATALEKDDAASPMVFVLGTDGGGMNSLIVPAGGCRHPTTAETLLRTKRDGDNVRSDNDLFMDGAEVFAFTLRVVPRLVRETLQFANWTPDDVDFYVLHQANRFIIDHLTRRIKIPPSKVINSIEVFGNTSSASIPLTLTYGLAEVLRNQEKRLLLIGFGVGFSWGAAALHCGPACISEMVLVTDDVGCV